MTTARPADYWISPSALYIQLNAAGDRDYIFANCAASAAVLCYVSNVPGLGYDAGHNYKRWTLAAAPTTFHDQYQRYVYIAIPRTSDAKNAIVVFPPEIIDIYGKNAAEEQIGKADYYYINTGGIISASTAGERTWVAPVNCGTLSSDEALAAAGGEGTWWEYYSVTDAVKFLKHISEAIFDKLTATYASITQLVLKGRVLNSVATIGDDSEDDTPENANDAVVTPRWGENHWLSKTHDDTAAGSITLLNNFTVNGETLLKRTVTVGNFDRDIQAGLGARDGLRLLPDGTILAKSLELSQSLSVPTLKYNSIEVLAGTRWDSAGKGRVKEIIDTDGTQHTCRFVLDLNDGEPGEFVVDDILRGFWHNSDETVNATANADDRRGNIARAGFESIYCRVIDVQDVVERKDGENTLYILKDGNYAAVEDDRTLQAGLVTVQVRQYDTTPVTFSPYPSQWAVLSVSGSFSSAHPERQKFFVYTTSYLARFEGVNTWEWDEHTFMGGWGDLTGFVMLGQTSDGTVTRKEFTGEGFVTKDAHIYGVLDQFTRFSDSLLVALSRPDGTIADGERLRADFGLRDIEGNAVTGARLTITRQSGDAAADTSWNEAMKRQYTSGIPSALYFEYADVPEVGAVYVVAAEREVAVSGGTETFTTSAAFTITRAVPQEMFMGEWDSSTIYNRTSRTYPTVTHGGCKWWLVSSTDTGTEPSPVSDVWHMVYGVTDLSICFYNADGQRITSAAVWPGHVNIYLDPHLLCGNYDITDTLPVSAWSWDRYTGVYGEQTDTRTAADRQSDGGWKNAHWPTSNTTRDITITNGDMPPTWGSGPVVTFIVTAEYGGIIIPNTVIL